MNRKLIENSLREFLYNRTEIIFAYIFGSFVQMDNYHDIDVAVFLSDDFDINDPEKLPYGYESMLLSELKLLARKNIDVVVMNNTGILMQQRIINKGILLFSKDERKRISYENHIRKLYIDAEPLRMIKKYYLGRKIINA